VTGISAMANSMESWENHGKIMGNAVSIWKIHGDIMGIWFKSLVSWDLYRI